MKQSKKSLTKKLTREQKKGKVLAGKLGKSKLATVEKNCASCAWFSSCSNPKQSPIYRCGYFSTDKGSLLQAPSLILPSFTSGSSLGSASLEPADSRNILISALEADEAEIDVNDESMPLAANFYEFMTDRRFNSFEPFPKQLETAFHLFAEYCVAKGTMVQTDKGLLRIEDMCSNKSVGMYPATYKVQTTKGVQVTSHAGLTSKRRKCITIYSNGVNITVTPEHRIQVATISGGIKWKQAKDVTTDDYLTSVVGSNLWPKQAYTLNDGTNVTSDLARFIGYTIADGHFHTVKSKYYNFGFINTNKALMDDYVNCVRTLFGITVTPYKYLPKDGSTPVYECRFMDTNLGNKLMSWGFIPGDCYTKRIPDFILQSNRQHVIDFIRAVFDCDGYIQKYRVGITLANRKVVDDLHLLLVNLGIYCNKDYHSIKGDNTQLTYKRKNNDVRNQRGEINIREKYVSMFANIIGTKNTHRVKQNNWNKFNSVKPKFATVRVNARPGQLPYFKPLLASIREEVGKNSYHDSAFGKYFNTFNRKNSITLNELNKVKSVIKRVAPHSYATIQNLASLNYAYHRVTIIKDAGYCEVYDLTVPVNESFQANGILVHNCPRCSTPDYVKNIPVDAGWDAENEKMISYEEILKNVTLLRHGVCPKCGAERKDLLANKELRYYNELTGVAGQRGSKSLSVSFYECYNIHRWIKLRHFFRKYNIASNTTLISNYIALTLNQATENLWDPIYNFIEQSRWFKDYFKLLDREGDRLGQELYILNKTGIKWKHARLSIYPTIPEEGKLRGRTRFGGWIDEISRFGVSEGDAKKRVDADDVHDALSRSLLTLRAPHRKLSLKYNDVPGPMSGNISSPFSKRDKVMRLYEESQLPDSEMYGFHYATWEMSPKYPRSSLDAEFRRNYVTAMRDYGAIPPNSGNPFIGQMDLLRACVIKDKRNLGEITADTITTKGGETMVSGKFSTKYTITDSVPRVMAIDAGLVNNSFAITIAHNEVEKDESEKDEQGNPKTYKIPTYDLIAEVIPHSGLQLNHAHIYTSLIQPLAKAFNVKLLVADRWQSEKMLRDAETDMGIKAETYSLKYGDFADWRNDLLACGIYLPKPEIEYDEILKVADAGYPQSFIGSPVSHFFYQCLTVQDISGKTVTKGSGSTDDMFRACVLAYSFLVDKNYADLLSGIGTTSTQGRGGLMGALQTRSGANSTNALNISGIAAMASKSRR